MPFLIPNFMQNEREVSGFYSQIRDYWTALGSKGSAPPTMMLNFGYWPQGVEHLYEAQQSLVRRVVECIAPCPDGAMGVEVGCGIGGISINVLQQLPHVRMTGVDISEDQLEIARANAQARGVQDRFHAQQGDSMALPLPSNAFDFGLCIESSFHYDNKPLFFSELFRALRPGSTAVVADITCSRVDGVQFRKGNYFESPATYHQLIRDTGFELVSSEDIGPVVYAPLYQHIQNFNAEQRNRDRIAKYWSLVLNNYRELASEGDMGYYIFTLKKPEAPALNN